MCDEAALFGLTISNIPQHININYKEPIQKYLLNNYIDLAVDNQSYDPSLGTSPFFTQREDNSIDERIRSGYQTVEIYELLDQQMAAREAIDFPKVYQYAIEFKESCMDRSISEDICVLKGLTKWFKKDFFRWCNKPKCENCNSTQKDIESLGMAQPTLDEQRNGWTNRVELYQCKKCMQQLRFPRINNPSLLLQTRKGRCGEWANCFCLICRSLNFDARYVLDFTDHVWVEVFVPSFNRFIHIDPCENKLDTPLLYEGGWNKKLSYIFSFSRYGVCDTISRYSRQIVSGEVFSRRLLTTEKRLLGKVERMHNKAFSNYSSKYNTTFDGNSSNFTISKLLAGKSAFDTPQDLSIEEVLRRTRLLNWELNGFRILIPGQLSHEETQGRISGDASWRLARGEISTENGLKEDSESVHPVVSIVSDRCPWMQEGLLLSRSRQNNFMNIFVFSAGMDDKLDSRSNGHTSTPAHLHSQGISTGGVFSPCYISVNGIPICSANRGHNIALLRCRDNSLVASCCFDTWGNGAVASQELEAFFNRHIPLSTSLETRNTSANDSYVLICNVLDSGENIKDNVSAILNNYFHEYTNRDGTSKKLFVTFPKHREASLLIAYISPQRQMSRVIDNVITAISQGPIMTRLRLHLSNDGDCLSNQPVLKSFSGYICSIPQRIINANENESHNDFVARVEALCIDDHLVAGFSILVDSNIAMLFEYSGLPLLESASSTTYLKHKSNIENSNNSSKETSSVDSLSNQLSDQCLPYRSTIQTKYLTLGGNQYDDTIGFDTSYSIWDMVDSMTENRHEMSDVDIWSALELSRLTIYAGVSTVYIYLLLFVAHMIMYF
jgi:hypothetical protein